MTMNEIINGKDNLFPGLIPLIRRFLRRAAVEVDTLRTLQKYLELLQHRASGLFSMRSGLRQTAQSPLSQF
ncbi:glutamate--cysteine ligase-like isoform X1 [Tachypleus tridentatus]|uniref:glutamate--cysteine ligase-like isoform X1 n=1 Tax=Tachypleus tridentatus TaxID=6853 RepID=UPI003FD3A5DB